MSLEEDLRRATDIIEGAGALFICAGAGMGVDSGLPDFRGNEGFGMGVLWAPLEPLSKNHTAHRFSATTANQRREARGIFRLHFERRRSVSKRRLQYEPH